jgi:hypothetical protein
MLKQYAMPKYMAPVQTFEQYWKQNEQMLLHWGVSKQVAHIIWCDAINAMHNVLVEKLLKEITEHK